MADVFTDSTQWANLLATGYDKFLEYQLRSNPVFRQFVDKYPVNVTNIGPSIVLSIMQEYTSLPTTPLSESSDVASVAPPAPKRVTVSVNEYGTADVSTLRLRQLAFTPPDPATANLLGKNMVDTLDALVRNVADTASHKIGYNGGTLKTDAGFAEASVASTDIFDTKIARDSVALLRRRNVHTRDGGNYVALMHPDVVVDAVGDVGWLYPHQYVDTQNIYNAEVGTYLGARYVQTPRCTVTADGVTSGNVYRTYFWGAQALVEATIADAHVVIGPQVDRLRRFNSIGWLYHGGWAVFRDEGLEIAHTASSIAAL